MKKLESAKKTKTSELTEDIQDIKISVYDSKKSKGNHLRNEKHEIEKKGHIMIGISERRRFIRKINKYNNLLNLFIQDLTNNESNVFKLEKNLKYVYIHYPI